MPAGPDPALPHSEAVEPSAPEMAAGAAAAASGTERPRKPSITRHRRLSIISMADEQKTERGAAQKDPAGRTIQAGANDRHRRLSVAGLYTGEEHPPEDNGAGADPTSSERVNAVSAVGYTSKAGFEGTGHKKTNQDAFVVLEVSQWIAPAR